MTNSCHKVVLSFIARRYFWLAYVLYFAVCFGFYALREVSVGADTDNYISYFNRVQEGNYDSRYEPLFSIVTVVSSYLSNSFYVYSALLFFLLSFAYFFSANKFSKDIALSVTESVVVFCLLTSFTVFSSWYFTAATNALRHGLSLAFLYVGLLAIYRRSYMFFVVFYIISIGFHYSAIMLLPFLITMGFLLHRSVKQFASVFLAVAILYPIGVNELIVRLISDISGFGVYEKISDFVGDDARWVGFQWEFFGYSLFWLFMLFLIRPFIKCEHLEAYDFLAKLYMFLLMPYMVFGFGGFSNRYAFIGWLFIPILQSFSVVMLKVGLPYKLLFAALLLMIALVFQVFRFGYWDNYF